MEEDRDRISNLPLELKVEIFSRMSLKQLISLKRVSKRWHGEINSHEFTKLHLRHQHLNPSSNGASHLLLVIGHRSSPSSFFSFAFSPASDQLVLKKTTLSSPPHFKTTPHEFVGSCNGLLCFQETHLGFFRVFNPATGAHRIIPPSQQCSHNAGFGYDSKRDDYKVLSISSYKRAHIYSMKKGLWKPVFNTNMLRRFICSMQPCMVIFRNVLYWVTSNDEDDSTIVSSFNLSTDEYNELAPPDEVLNPTDVELVVLDGRLHIINITIVSRIDIWVLNFQDSNSGAKQSWAKLLRCALAEVFSTSYDELNLPWVWTSGFRSLPTYSKDSREILLGFHQWPQHLVSLDLQTGKIRRVDLIGLPDGEHDEFITVPWKPSLVSPSNFA